MGCTSSQNVQQCYLPLTPFPFSQNISPQGARRAHRDDRGLGPGGRARLVHMELFRHTLGMDFEPRKVRPVSFSPFNTSKSNPIPSPIGAPGCCWRSSTTKSSTSPETHAFLHPPTATWPWVKIQIVHPVNIPIPTEID